MTGTHTPTLTHSFTHTHTHTHATTLQDEEEERIEPENFQHHMQIMRGGGCQGGSGSRVYLYRYGLWILMHLGVCVMQQDSGRNGRP